MISSHKNSKDSPSKDDLAKDVVWKSCSSEWSSWLICWKDLIRNFSPCIAIFIHHGLHLFRDGQYPKFRGSVSNIGWNQQSERRSTKLSSYVSRDNGSKYSSNNVGYKWWGSSYKRYYEVHSTYVQKQKMDQEVTLYTEAIFSYLLAPSPVYAEALSSFVRPQCMQKHSSVICMQKHSQMKCRSTLSHLLAPSPVYAEALWVRGLQAVFYSFYSSRCLIFLFTSRLPHPAFMFIYSINYLFFKNFNL